MCILNMTVIDFEEKIVTQCEEYQDQVAKCSTPSANGYCDNLPLPRQSTTSPPLKQHTAQVFHF